MSKTGNSKIVGILGGMGPMAGVDIQKKIITNTKAERDQDHIKIIYYNNPAISDRSDFINGTGKSPVADIIEGLRKLEDFGADFLVIACNTSHIFLPEIKKSTKKPIISIVDETVSYISKEFKDPKIGILATRGSIKMGLYSSPLRDLGYRIIDIPEDIQMYVDLAIKNAKGRSDLSSARRNILKVVEFLTSNRASVIVMGCTEIPLIMPAKIEEVCLVDPNEIISLSIINRCLWVKSYLRQYPCKKRVD